MATLKISDLSVGDWVQDMGGNYTKVVGIWQGCNFSYQVDLHRDGVSATIASCNIHPIPITPETLEKNGFENMGSGLMRYEFELREKKYTIILGSLDEEVWFADFYFMRKKNINSNIPLFYIHQLQHILRLAGVDKEINL